MADRPPPGRYSVVERGGRLVVIDRETGRTPPSAAERMADYDRRMGNEPALPAAQRFPTDAFADPSAPVVEQVIEPPAPPVSDRMVATVAAMNRKQPWKDQRPAAGPARIAQRPQPRPQSGAKPGARKTIVTGKWWDAKGPRTIELGPKGQQVLSGGFATLFFVALIAAVVALLVAPILLFFAAFLLFRFGGKILGPIGAGIVDKALAEKG
ncbi:MAG TPA: hypothetical protein VHO04_10520 [Sphingopyxis sp.]|uniref:hypothetical protein n=1 Tax=Sphingopyxis sp. TaxID=1908224 RepID=UPI002E3824CD|nr:hypothetical protein [Sphingopyxis sp.]HEX2813107.1 hypothetical protein [Sphingopyxis sp.]